MCVDDAWKGDYHVSFSSCSICNPLRLYAGSGRGSSGERGLAVDIQPMRDVRTLDQYRAVVLGAPLYMFHWHKDALHFLERYRAALTARPVAIFALGPFQAEEKDFQEVRGQLDKELAKFPWLTPAAIAIFGGKFDPTKLTFPHNLLPALKNMPASDVRDWTAIRAWANDLAAQFQPAMA
jgi:menaquinone-dependent protoporphyrinogen oxidase